MTAVQPPLYLGSPVSHGADSFRRLIRAVAPTVGTVGGADLTVAANGTPNMSVNVATGEAVLPGTESVTVQGSYHVLNDATVNLVISASDPTNPRNDLVVAKVRDADYSGANRDWLLSVVTGTPAASPADPVVPANSITLARVRVDAAVSSIVAGKITDLRARAAALGAVAVCTSTTRPAGTRGQHIFETDTGKVLVYYGATTGWAPQWGTAWGRAAYVNVGATGQSVAGSDVDVTGLTVTFTTLGARRYRIASCMGIKDATTTDFITCKIRDGAGTVLAEDTLLGGLNASFARAGRPVAPDVAPSAGPVTYKGTCLRFNGAGTATVDQVIGGNFLLVEDVGPNGNAPAS